MCAERTKSSARLTRPDPREDNRDSVARLLSRNNPESLKERGYSEKIEMGAGTRSAITREGARAHTTAADKDSGY